MLQFRSALTCALLGSAVLVSSACDSGRHAAAGFRLPAYGNPERGKATFVSLGCHGCHEVSGADLPAPPTRGDRLLLGGMVPREVTAGYIVTSIINPAYRRTHPRPGLKVGKASPMPDPGERISVSQLTDLVAFLEPRYDLRRPSARYPVYY